MSKNPYPTSQDRPPSGRAFLPPVAHVVLAVLVASTAGAAVLLPFDEDAELTTFEGTVVEVHRNPHWNVSVEYSVEVAGEDGTTFEVKLGPPWWWASVGLPEINVDDTLRVEGALEGSNVIEAYTIWVNGGNAIVLRTGGKPAWAEVASGRPMNEDDAD